MSGSAYEEARTVLVEKLRSVGLDEEAEDLLMGHLMRVQTWVVLELLSVSTIAKRDQAR